MESIATRIRRDIRQFGVVRTAYEVFMKGINRCFCLRIVKVFKKEVYDPAFVENHEDFQWRFLSERRMFDLARDPDNQLTESFVRTALEKGDACYGGFDGEALACFGWYSNEPTDDDGLTFHFGPEYMYEYAAFTYPKYRGRRLSVSRGNRARREYLSRGFKGTVFTIDSHNFHSLRSSLVSLGVQYIGCILVLKIGRHVWIHANRGCREQGVYLAKPAVAATRPGTALNSINQ